jgi:hypothetical protein
VAGTGRFAQAHAIMHGRPVVYWTDLDKALHSLAPPPRETSEGAEPGRPMVDYREHRYWCRSLTQPVGAGCNCPGPRPEKETK